MPSSVGSGPKLRSLTSGEIAVLRGQRYLNVPDFFISIPDLAAAHFTGANSGIWVFTAPRPAMFLGGTAIWEVAGTNNIRVKKVLAASVETPGAGADADNVTISEVIDVTATADTAVDIVPVTDDLANQLAGGDKVALASAAGSASLSGGLVVLQFAWL